MQNSLPAQVNDEQRKTQLYDKETEMLASLIGRTNIQQEIDTNNEYMDINLWLELDNSTITESSQPSKSNDKLLTQINPVQSSNTLKQQLRQIHEDLDVKVDQSGDCDLLELLDS